jgi:hypothetical protein
VSTITALASALERDYPAISVDVRPDGLTAKVAVDVPGIDGPLVVTADKQALDELLVREAEVLARWWPDRDAEQALAGLLSVHLAETIATLRPNERSIRLGDPQDRPPPKPEVAVPGARAFAPASGRRYRSRRTGHP